ncbi:hypothetical protein RIF29_17658 [Crotalaria pallida]|uniref:Inhibitor I9 domain-containing protein n=1 Tax=Crotalaria pallida TaxID=3830 RepID=A0AAN9ID62_CROPI
MNWALTPYIVYLGGHSHGPDPSPDDLKSATDSHYDLLGSVLGSNEKAKEAIVYSYNKHINGFAALLEEEEASEIAKNPDVVSVFLSKEHKLHTTRSWDFLGLEKDGKIPASSAWRKARFGENIIIANIDTGVWPEHRSFNDKGYGPIPSKWRGKGVCDIGLYNASTKNFCNSRLCKPGTLDPRKPDITAPGVNVIAAYTLAADIWTVDVSGLS